MRAVFTEPFQRRFKKLSPEVKRKFEKQLLFLLKDISHPSLRAKKYDEGKNIWQARVNGSFRFYFQIRSDIYVILNVVKHPK